MEQERSISSQRQPHATVPTTRAELLLSVRTRRAVAVLLSSLAFLVFVEVTLRVAPAILGHGQLANLTFARYGHGPADMYFIEPTSRMTFLKPNFATTAFFSGYFWRHESDALGFRNPVDCHDRKVLLLGDSLIYGHGVGEEFTVAHRLRHQYRMPVYSMARQGDCLYQEYVLLRLYLAQLQPEVVVLFAFLNDFSDLELYRSSGEIDAAEEVSAFDYDAIRTHVATLGNQHDSMLRQLWSALRTPSFLQGLYTLYSAPPADGARPNSVHLFAAPFEDAEWFHRIERYYDRILADLATRSRAAGARLWVIHLEIYFPDGKDPVLVPAQRRFHEVLRSVTSAHDIAFTGTGDLFRKCDECFLAHDGHFTAVAHERLASFVHATLSDRGRSAIAEHSVEDALQ